MNRILLFAIAYCAGIGFANATVRDTSSIARNQTENRAATVRAQTPGKVSQKTTSARTTTNTVIRNTPAKTQSRATTTTPATRTSTVRPTMGRSATTARTAITTPRNTTAPQTSRSARAAITTTASRTFGTGYTTCHDAYFTCMDQFCANQNETYRRCVCSSRLADIQSRERLLAQTATQLQDFKDLNIEVIPKTAAEVKAMLSATEGESIATTARDKSAANQALAGISAVLAGTKNKALSTQGTLDIAGDINAIWATTDLASGVAIANLTGESLYNAVHSQCVDLVASQCTSQSTLNMVVSAYGMYIENDCNLLKTALDKKTNAASGTIRETEREMNTARLENYDAHNSTSINDCIAQVRQDITADNACGPNYVHCLDVSGRYLNRDTGEPIYTADFYQLGNLVSLNGDILNNQTNRLTVAELNRKRIFAERGLGTCRDLADQVWDEFMRQAITEIYQAQQSRIRQVKTECLDVVSTCYDEQNKSLKDFSNVKEQLMLGARMELSEEMCREKLYACANLYSNGNGGMAELLTAMHDITDQKIGQFCGVILKDFAKDFCAVPSNDTLHRYPFGCRAYRPGSQKYASIPQCLSMTFNPSNTQTGTTTTTPPLECASIKQNSTGGYNCPEQKQYYSCNPGYYMVPSCAQNSTQTGPGNACLPCPIGYICAGGTAEPQLKTNNEIIVDGVTYDCGDFPGSLYQKLARYARQACVRPSLSETDPTPATVLQDINTVMASIRVEMAQTLGAECERLGGIWLDTPGTAWDEDDKDAPKQFKLFYTETGANTEWGLCSDPSEDLARNCANTGGTWNLVSEICDCNDATTTRSWNEAKKRCVVNPTIAACLKDKDNTHKEWSDNRCVCANGYSMQVDGTCQKTPTEGP